MRISMPDEYKAIKLGEQMRVFYEASEMPAEDERKRVTREGGFDYTDGVATLTVPDPKPGFKYAICWTPPPAQTLGG